MIRLAAKRSANRVVCVPSAHPQSSQSASETSGKALDDAASAALDAVEIQAHQRLCSGPVCHAGKRL